MQTAYLLAFPMTIRKKAVSCILCNLILDTDKVVLTSSR